MKRIVPILCASRLAASADTVDDLWKLPVLYKNDHTLLREFALSANIQWQWADGNGSEGSFGSRDRPDELRWGDVEARRIELGFRSQWGDKLKFSAHVEPNIDGRSSPDMHGGAYRDLHDLSFTYAFDPAFTLGIGKVTPKYFAYEDIVSSREMTVFERSLVVTQLIPPELTGIRAEGKVGLWSYGTGIFAGESMPEFPEFNAGMVLQNMVGYNYATAAGLDEAIVRLCHQYSTSDENSGGPGLFDHAVSLNTFLREGRFNFYADLIGAHGRDATGNIAGITLAPSWFFTKQLEMIFRYQHAIGSDDALQLSSRYERLAPRLTDSGGGKAFDAAYLGLNYYIHGHKLKLMAAAEYQHMDGGSDGGDYEGITCLTGLRMSF